MLPILHLLRLENYPIFKQLLLEEALLRTDNRNWCILNTGSPPAIVMGISGKPELLIDSKKIQQNPIPVIRRFSGGGTVVIDEHTCFVTFICQSTSLHVSCCPQKVLRWTEPLYRPLFPDSGFHIAENDYAFHDKKFGGNAQYFRKDRWLHHSSLLWDFCPQKMRYLQLPPKMPSYRQERSHDEFLCRMKPFYSTRQGFFDSLVETFQLHFDVKKVSLSSIENSLSIPHRKATEFVDMKI